MTALQSYVTTIDNDQLIIISLTHHHLFRLIMTEINDAEVTVNGDFVAHLERMAIDLTKLVVDINFKAVATDHTDLAQTHRRDRRM